MISPLPFDILHAILDTVDDKQKSCFLLSRIRDAARCRPTTPPSKPRRHHPGTQGWRGFRHGCGTGRNLRGLRGILSIPSVPRNAETTPSPETLCAQVQSLQIEDDGLARLRLHRPPGNLLSTNSPGPPSTQERHPLQATLSQ
ncbi:hypothetical protein JCM5353_002523 [Sporobolomyces roseus]